jgi:hypothetical protein
MLLQLHFFNYKVIHSTILQTLPHLLLLFFCYDMFETGSGSLHSFVLLLINSILIPGCGSVAVLCHERLYVSPALRPPDGL